jgi:hypothetical protein
MAKKLPTKFTITGKCVSDAYGLSSTAPDLKLQFEKTKEGWTVALGKVKPHLSPFTDADVADLVQRCQAAVKTAAAKIATTPTWPGADVVYSRLYRLLEKLNRQEAQQQRAHHIKKGRRPNTFRYNPPDYIRDIIDGLKRGDEEYLKGIMHQYEAYDTTKEAAVKTATLPTKFTLDTKCVCKVFDWPVGDRISTLLFVKTDKGWNVGVGEEKPQLSPFTDADVANLVQQCKATPKTAATKRKAITRQELDDLLQLTEEKVEQLPAI